MNTNRSGVKENAFSKINPKVYGENYDHIFKKKDQIDDDLECRICGKYCVSYPCNKCGYNGEENEQPVSKNG